MPSVKSYRSSSIRFGNAKPSNVLSVKSHLTRFSFTTINAVASRRLLRTRVSVAPRSVSTAPQAKRIFRYFNIRGCVSFSSQKYRRINLLENPASKSVTQDKDFWIIDKSKLAEFGLNASEDNSLNELLVALILYWSDNLESERIDFMFYRHINFEENGQFYDTQSYLINVLAVFPDRVFPSPQSFTI